MSPATPKTSKQSKEATELRSSEEKYRKLFMNLPISTVEVAFGVNNLVIVDANYQAIQTYGEWLAQNTKPLLERLFTPERKKDIDIIKKQSSRTARMTLESIHLHAHGETFPVRISISFDSKLSSSHIILMIEDITSEMNRRSEEIAISEERARMARKIHDGIAQDLVSLKMRAHNWKELIELAPQNLNAEVDYLQNLLENDILEVRRSIFALRPLSLDQEGFYPAITRYVREFGEQNGIITHLWLCEDPPNLAEEMEITLFRMMQESLNNVAKHASAINVWISLMKNDDRSISIEIRDDGVGFNIEDLEAKQHQGHSGLSQMQERVRENHGKFEIASEKNKGVAIQISLPIREKLG